MEMDGSFSVRCAAIYVFARAAIAISPFNIPEYICQSHLGTSTSVLIACIVDPDQPPIE